MNDRVQSFHVDRSSVQNFLTSFCAAYKAWNDSTMARYESEGKRVSVDIDVQEYDDFLSHFVCPTMDKLLPAYGTDSSFDPERLKITAIVEGQNVSEVTFEIQSSYADWGNEYVAKIIMTPHMMLEQIFYVDPHPVNGATHLPCLSVS
jgi:hypothetical protein